MNKKINNCRCSNIAWGLGTSEENVLVFMLIFTSGEKTQMPL